MVCCRNSCIFWQRFPFIKLGLVWSCLLYYAIYNEMFSYVRKLLQLEYCKEVTSKLKASGIRVEVCSGERLPKLIRNAEKQKIPLMAVVGPKEVETQTVTVRSRFSGELGTITIEDFIGICKKAVESRTSVWNSCSRQFFWYSVNPAGICDVYTWIKQLDRDNTIL